MFVPCMWHPVQCGSLEPEKSAHVTLHLQFDAASTQLIVNVEVTSPPSIIDGANLSGQ